MCYDSWLWDKAPKIVKLFLMLFIAPFLSFFVAFWLIYYFILRLRKNQLADLGNLKVEHH